MDVFLEATFSDEPFRSGMPNKPPALAVKVKLVGAGEVRALIEMLEQLVAKHGETGGVAMLPGNVGGSGLAVELVVPKLIAVPSAAGPFNGKGG